MKAVKKALLSIFLAGAVTKIIAIISCKHMSSCHKCSKKAKTFCKNLHELLSFRNKCFCGLMQRKKRLFAQLW